MASWPSSSVPSRLPYAEYAILDYQLSQHAREELVRRGIPVGVVDAVVHSPEQTVTDATGLAV